jgi:hypothetical protein
LKALVISEDKLPPVSLILQEETRLIETKIISTAPLHPGAAKNQLVAELRERVAQQELEDCGDP